MQGIGMLIKPHYIKDYTVQNHPVQGPTVIEIEWYITSQEEAVESFHGRRRTLRNNS